LPDEIDLTAEDEEILDCVWDRRREEARLEELGQGPPRWGQDRARYERPKLTTAELEEWVRVANDEYRRLCMKRVAQPEADRLSLLAANERFPAGTSGRAEKQLQRAARPPKDESKPRRYPEQKQRELSDEEKAQLRARIERSDGDIYALAGEFGCSPSQVAGIKAAMHR
jgi:hypothetical protein